MRHALRNLCVALLAGAVLVGCQSQPEEPAPAPAPEPTPIVESTKPTTPPPPPRVDEEGYPLDTAGRPIGRTFYFDFDQARLSESDLRVLAMHADFLRDFRDRSVMIEGHCDERGTREYNLALGERRAQAVERYLSSAGVRASQIDTVSYGEERPAAAGQNESAYSRNRRAVLIYR